MKNDLTCGVVQDLLPGFMEGLSGMETREAVERHLSQCPACARRRDTMAALPVEAAAETVKEVNYLKRIRRRNLLRVLAVAAAVALVLAGGVFVKFYVIGTPAQWQSMALDFLEAREGDTLQVYVYPYHGPESFWGWKTEQTDGVLTVSARRVNASPLFPNKQIILGLPLEGVTEVRMGGEIIWQDGLIISEKTIKLYNAQTPYLGDAAALGRIANALQLSDLGTCTTSLQTSQRPYRWTLDFQRTDSEINRRMNNYYGPLMLALVDNLDEMSWTDETTGAEHVLPLERVNARLPGLTEWYNRAHGTAWEAKESVKDYADSPGDFQRLVAILQYRLDYRQTW